MWDKKNEEIMIDPMVVAGIHHVGEATSSLGGIQETGNVSNTEIYIYI